MAIEGFEDVYLPLTLRQRSPFVATPRTKTSITQSFGGGETRGRQWMHPLYRLTAPEAVACQEDIEDIIAHWLVMGGPLLTFPIRDPMDFASRRLQKASLTPDLAITDQVLGVADGVTTVYQLTKTYIRGSRSYIRPIYLPLADSVIVGLNALEPENTGLPGGPYTVAIEREGGTITITPAPEAGIVITAGFLFDLNCRFETDESLDVVLKAFQLSGAADLSFVEVRPC